jgi:hypothetical protein
MNAYHTEKPKNVVPFESSKGNESETSELDRSGHAIIALLADAAEAARANEERAMGVARKLSDQLQAAEDRIRGLQAEVERCQDHASRAEEWLLRVYREIEDQFLPRQDTASFQNNARR